MDLAIDEQKIEGFKSWLLSTNGGMCVMNLPQDKPIVLEIGDSLAYERHETATMPCAKCEAGFTNLNIEYQGKSVTIESGTEIDHLSFLDVDNVTQSMWAFAWNQGYVRATYMLQDEALYRYNWKKDRYEREVD